jgi:nitrogen fixation NifU-like protein
VKGKTVEQAMALKNTDIVKELNLPPVKIHCSVLAEDAIKSAIADFRRKQAVARGEDPAAAVHPAGDAAGDVVQLER